MMSKNVPLAKLNIYGLGDCGRSAFFYHASTVEPVLGDHHTCQLLRISRKLYGFFVPLWAYGHFLTDFFIHEIIHFFPFDMLILFEIVQLAR